MTIWTSNARIRKDIWHNLYGEVTTFAKSLHSSDFANVVLNSYNRAKQAKRPVLWDFPQDRPLNSSIYDMEESSISSSLLTETS